MLAGAEKHAARSQPDQPTRACAQGFFGGAKKDISAGPRWSVNGSYLAITAQLRPATMSHMLTLAGSKEERHRYRAIELSVNVIDLR